MLLNEIGHIIASCRKDKKLTQQKLGNPLGMSRSTISGLENGTIPEIGIRKILSLCDALGLELIVQVKTKRPTLQKLLKERNDD